jgi:hypothetical protein
VYLYHRREMINKHPSENLFSFERRKTSSAINQLILYQLFCVIKAFISMDK